MIVIIILNELTINLEMYEICKSTIATIDSFEIFKDK